MSITLAVVGASIFLMLGVAHAIFSFQSQPDRGPLMPTSPAVRAAMAEVGGLGMAPEIESTLFRAWIGFNLSHALGIIAISGILLTQILTDFGQAVDQAWFLVLVALAPLLYFLLAVKYWFDKPRDGIAMGTLLLWAGVIVELV